jgi:hypothetical protein
VFLHTTFGSCWKGLSHYELVLPTALNLVAITFAISAQLLPASLIVFNLCSSAGVHGVFVRLFFAGGPIEEPMLGPSALAIGGAGFDGPDMVDGGDAGAGGRLLLFRGVIGAAVSVVWELSVTTGRVGLEVDDDEPVLSPISTLSPPRLDIEKQDERRKRRVRYR